jgi:manganese/zinc/iron transport system substrate-binding protein
MFFGSPKPVACGGPATGLLAAALLGLAALIGCAPRGPAPVKGKPLVVATTTIVADLVRQVAGDRVTIDCLMGDGIDPHSYKATPRDADRLRAADLVVASGLHLEGKLADLLEKLADRVPVVAVADSLPRDQLLDAGAGFHDPHVWFDARLWSGCIPAVEKALVAIDPAGAAEYGRRADAHRRELEAADEAVRRTIAAIPPSRRVLVTAHDAFRYFGRAYRIEVVGVQGTSTESEAGLNDVNRLVGLLVERGIPAVFVETSVSDRNVAALVEGAAVGGHKVAIGGRLYSDSLGAAGSGAETLVGAVEANARTIAAALDGAADGPPVPPGKR